MPRFLRWLEQLGARVRIEVCREPGASLQNEMRLGKIDLVLDWVVIPGEGFRRKRVLDVELVSMVRQDHPTVGQSLTIDEYMALDHMILEPREGQTNLAEHIQAVVERSRCVLVQIPHYLSMPFIVSQSNLVCTLPRPLARLFEQHFPVRVVNCPLPVQPIPLFMMWHGSQEADPAHQWLRRSLIELCSRI